MNRNQRGQGDSLGNLLNVPRPRDQGTTELSAILREAGVDQSVQDMLAPEILNPPGQQREMPNNIQTQNNVPTVNPNASRRQMHDQIRANFERIDAITDMFNQNVASHNNQAANHRRD